MNFLNLGSIEDLIKIGETDGTNEYSIGKEFLNDIDDSNFEDDIDREFSKNLILLMDTIDVHEPFFENADPESGILYSGYQDVYVGMSGVSRISKSTVISDTDAINVGAEKALQDYVRTRGKYALEEYGVLDEIFNLFKTEFLNNIHDITIFEENIAGIVIDIDSTWDEKTRSSRKSLREEGDNIVINLVFSTSPSQGL